MVSRTAIGGILRADALRLVRDQFLLGMCAYIIGVAVMLRFAMPWITGELAERTAFDLVPWYPLISSHFVVGLAVLMAGIIGGLLLMEGRESRTVKALLVTPVPLALALASPEALARALDETLRSPSRVIVPLALPLFAVICCRRPLAFPTEEAELVSLSADASAMTEKLPLLTILPVASPK